MKPLPTTANNCQPPQTLAQPACPLCVHTLEDLRNFLRAYTSAGRTNLRPVSAVRILKVFAPLGFNTVGMKADDLHTWLRYVRHWCRHDTTARRVVPLPGALEALQIPSADHARSLHRVLHQLVEVQQYTSCFIGLLIHASRPEGIHRTTIATLPWSKDVRNQRHLIPKLQKLGLLQAKLEWYPHANRHLETFRLTRNGERLLLGHWGAATRIPTDPTTSGLHLAA